MFSNNVGTIDRILRVVVGIALIAGYFLFPNAAWGWLFWIGVIPLFTGLFGTCPLYRLFGISTCPMQRR
jgi:hypothetical protein